MILLKMFIYFKTNVYVYRKNVEKGFHVFIYLKINIHEFQKKVHAS